MDPRDQVDGGLQFTEAPSSRRSTPVREIQVAVPLVRRGRDAQACYTEQNRMNKILICALETIAHISRQISNVPLQCLLHSGI